MGGTWTRHYNKFEIPKFILFWVFRAKSREMQEDSFVPRNRAVVGKGREAHIAGKLSRTLVARDSEFVVKTMDFGECVLRVPNAEKLNGPGGFTVNAVDGCAMNIPPMRDFWRVFSENYSESSRSSSSTEDSIVFGANLVMRSSPAANLDNPGHALLAMRVLSGDDICRAHSAYILALAKCTLPPGAPQKSLMDPNRLLWFHAGICKTLGSSYCAAPVPRKGTARTTANHIVILEDILERAAITVLRGRPFTDAERKDIQRELTKWHCPRYVREECPIEAEKWSFDRPAERAEAFSISLRKINFRADLI